MNKKKLNRAFYRGERITKSVLGELMDSLNYLLYVTSSPISIKAVYTCFDSYSMPKSINMSISRLYKKGFISRIRKRGNPFIMSNQNSWGIKDYYRSIKKEKHKKGWDKKWRMLIYDIPEKEKGKREALRCFINNFGFGRVQDSCWISAYDYSKEMSGFLKEEGISKYLCLYEGRFFSGKDINSLVEEVWKLKDMSKRYRRFIDKCREGIEFAETKEVGIKEYYKVYHDIYKEYRKILDDDPFLPDEFLKNNLRPKAEKFFNRFAKLIMGELKVVM